MVRKNGFVKRVKKFAKKAVKKRYFGGGGLNTAQIIKDVAMLKSVINAEKKRINLTSPTQYQIAQFTTSTGTNMLNAFFGLDITPYPLLGDYSYNRSGSSLKLTSSYMKIQIDQNTAMNNSGKVRFVILQIKGVPQSTPNGYATNNVFMPESWLNLQTGGTNAPDGTYLTGNNVITANSNYNPDFRGEYKILYDKKHFIPQRNYSGTNSGILKEFILKFKWNHGKGHHIRYKSTANTGTVSDLTDGQMFLYALADSGNASSTAYTGTGSTTVPSALANSGYLMQYNITHYFYDN